MKATAANHQPMAEPRARCPHCKKLLDKNSKCWACGKTPEQWEEAMQVVETQPQVEVEPGGEYGQLMLGIHVPQVAVQRKSEFGMTPQAFNLIDWDFREGDQITGKMKDGVVIVKLKSAWEADGE